MLYSLFSVLQKIPSRLTIRGQELRLIHTPAKRRKRREGIGQYLSYKYTPVFSG
jgi:hypothetical protein